MNMLICIAFDCLKCGIKVGRFGIIDPKATLTVFYLFLSMSITFERIEKVVVSFIKKYQPQKAVVLNRNLFATKRIQSTEILFFPLFFV